MTKDNHKIRSQKDLSKYHVQVLTEDWNNRLLKISYISPVKAGNLSIHFDRSPDIFAIPKITSYRYVPLGFFHGNQLIGFAIASYQKRYILGVLTDVIYLGNMHVTERGAGRIFLKKLTERVIQKVQNRPEIKYMYAYVMENNRPAQKLADLRVLGSKQTGTISMSTLFTLKPVALSDIYSVRKAAMADIDQIVTLLSNEYENQLLSPEINREIFLQNLSIRSGVDIENYYLAIRDDKIAGICLAWDMTTIKKNRIKYHGLKMNFLRHAYNLSARLTGSAQLPKPGEAFKDVTIAEYAIRNRDPEIMEALLRYIYSEYRQIGYHSVIFGCNSDDPLIQAIKPFITREVRSSVIIAPLQKDSESSFQNYHGIYADAIQI